jgi:hypothetical protein
MKKLQNLFFVILKVHDGYVLWRIYDKDISINLDEVKNKYVKKTVARRDKEGVGDYISKQL